MKKQIIITLILLLATVYATVVYFKNLNPPGMRTSEVMHAIPDNASLIFEFNNDKSFYDIFNGNKLFVSLVGKEKLDELDSLRTELLENPILKKYFATQNIFISVHPSIKNDIDLLLTIASTNGFDTSAFEQISKKANTGLLITPFHTSGKQGYNIYINTLKKRFYLINKENNIYSGSFSKELIEQSSNYKNQNKESFVLLSEQQNANSLATLYVNFKQIAPLFDQLFKNKNTDVFKSISILPALSALSLNYRSDALMFNGTTIIQKDNVANYLALFADQQPVANHLKDIFPSTTAYSTNFSVSNPLKFSEELGKQQSKTGFIDEKNKLFNKIRAETGTSLKAEFGNLLGNEFAIVNTRYFEKFAIISVNDGTKLKLLLTTISTMTDENTGQLIYNKIPFFLLGDAFSIFKRPYFMIIDNYLIFANNANELKSYDDIYINRKFLNQNPQYMQFDNLVAERSNIAYYFNLKNSLPILERDLYPSIYENIKTGKPGWSDFYSTSVQFTAADRNFYTNLCIKLNTDTANLIKTK